uniref:G_PROTEIN_RECEP_F1_2 domain-containing protein n=1 Tax=Rhabditophanes sp. KR3021 TaxID=114890 RepID=A0AC35U8Q8_9BILA
MDVQTNITIEDVSLVINNEECIEYYKLYPDPSSNPIFFVPFAVFYLIIFTMGIIGNVSIIYVTLKHKVLQSVQNMFILNLAASDIIVCLLSLPITPVTNVFKNWMFGEVLCRLIALVQGVSIYICTFSLGAIAVDRYILVVKPHAKALSREGALYLTGILWSLSLVLNVPYALFMYIENYEGICGVFCTEKWPNPSSRRAYTLMVMVAQFVFPFILMAFCYATIFSKLRTRARLRIKKIDERFIALGRSSNVHEQLLIEDDEGNFSTNNNNESNYVLDAAKDRIPSLAIQNEKDKQRLLGQTRRNTMILVSMVVIFGLTWLPHNVVSLVLEYDEDQTIFQISGYADLDLSYLVNLFTHSIAMTNIVFNPVLYAWLNPKFRELSIQTFFERRRRNSSLPKNTKHKTPPESSRKITMGAVNKSNKKADTNGIANVPVIRTPHILIECGDNTKNVTFLSNHNNQMLNTANSTTTIDANIDSIEDAQSFLLRFTTTIVITVDYILKNYQASNNFREMENKPYLPTYKKRLNIFMLNTSKMGKVNKHLTSNSHKGDSDHSNNKLSTNAVTKRTSLRTSRRLHGAQVAVDYDAPLPVVSRNKHSDIHEPEPSTSKSKKAVGQASESTSPPKITKETAQRVETSTLRSGKTTAQSLFSSKIIKDDIEIAEPSTLRSRKAVAESSSSSKTKKVDAEIAGLSSLRSKKAVAQTFSSKHVLQSIGKAETSTRKSLAKPEPEKSKPVSQKTPVKPPTFSQKSPANQESSGSRLTRSSLRNQDTVGQQSQQNTQNKNNLTTVAPSSSQIKSANLNKHVLPAKINAVATTDLVEPTLPPSRNRQSLVYMHSTPQNSPLTKNAAKFTAGKKDSEKSPTRGANKNHSSRLTSLGRRQPVKRNEQPSYKEVSTPETSSDEVIPSVGSLRDSSSSENETIDEQAAPIAPVVANRRNRTNINNSTVQPAPSSTSRKIEIQKLSDSEEDAESEQTSKRSTRFNPANSKVPYRYSNQKTDNPEQSGSRRPSKRRPDINLGCAPANKKKPNDSPSDDSDDETKKPPASDKIAKPAFRMSARQAASRTNVSKATSSNATKKAKGSKDAADSDKNTASSAANSIEDTSSSVGDDIAMEVTEDVTSSFQSPSGPVKKRKVDVSEMSPSKLRGLIDSPNTEQSQIKSTEEPLQTNVQHATNELVTSSTTETAGDANSNVATGEPGKEKTSEQVISDGNDIRRKILEMSEQKKLRKAKPRDTGLGNMDLAKDLARMNGTLISVPDRQSRLPTSNSPSRIANQGVSRLSLGSSPRGSFSSPRAPGRSPGRTPGRDFETVESLLGINVNAVNSPKARTLSALTVSPRGRQQIRRNLAFMSRTNNQTAGLIPGLDCPEEDLPIVHRFVSSLPADRADGAIYLNEEGQPEWILKGDAKVVGKTPVKSGILKKGPIVERTSSAERAVVFLNLSNSSAEGNIFANNDASIEEPIAEEPVSAVVEQVEDSVNEAKGKLPNRSADDYTAESVYESVAEAATTSQINPLNLADPELMPDLFVEANNSISNLFPTHSVKLPKLVKKKKLTKKERAEAELAEKNAAAALEASSISTTPNAFLESIIKQISPIKPNLDENDTLRAKRLEDEENERAIEEQEALILEEHNAIHNPLAESQRLAELKRQKKKGAIEHRRIEAEVERNLAEKKKTIPALVLPTSDVVLSTPALALSTPDVAPNNSELGDVVEKIGQVNCLAETKKYMYIMNEELIRERKVLAQAQKKILDLEQELLKTLNMKKELNAEHGDPAEDTKSKQRTLLGNKNSLNTSAESSGNNQKKANDVRHQEMDFQEDVEILTDGQKNVQEQVPAENTSVIVQHTSREEKELPLVSSVLEKVPEEAISIKLELEEIIEDEFVQEEPHQFQASSEEDLSTVRSEGKSPSLSSLDNINDKSGRVLHFIPTLEISPPVIDAFISPVNISPADPSLECTEEANISDYVDDSSNDDITFPHHNNRPIVVDAAAYKEHFIKQLCGKNQLLAAMSDRLAEILEFTDATISTFALDPVAIARDVKQMLIELGITQKDFGICVAHVKQSSFSNMLIKPPLRWKKMNKANRISFTQMFLYLTSEEAITYFNNVCPRSVNGRKAIPSVYPAERYLVQKPVNYKLENYPPVKLAGPELVQQPERSNKRKRNSSESDRIGSKRGRGYSTNATTVPRLQFLKKNHVRNNLEIMPPKSMLPPPIEVGKIRRDVIKLLAESGVSEKEFGRKFCNISDESFHDWLHSPLDYHLCTTNFKMLYGRLKKYMENETLISKLRTHGINGVPQNKDLELVHSTPPRRIETLPTLNTFDLASKMVHLFEHHDAPLEEFYVHYLETPVETVEQLLVRPILWNDCNITQKSIYTKLNKFLGNKNLLRAYLTDYRNGSSDKHVHVTYVNPNPTTSVESRPTRAAYDICQRFLILLSECKVSLTQFGSQIMGIDGTEFENIIRQPQPSNTAPLGIRKIYRRIETYLSDPAFVSNLQRGGIARIRALHLQ